MSELFLDLLAEGVEDSERYYGGDAAKAFTMIAQEMVSEVIVTTPLLLVSHYIEQGSIAVNRRQAPDGSTTETKKHLKGTERCHPFVTHNRATNKIDGH